MDRANAPILIVRASVAKGVIVATGIQQALTKAFADGVLVKLRFFNAMIARKTTISTLVFVKPPLPRGVCSVWLLQSPRFEWPPCFCSFVVGVD